MLFATMCTTQLTSLLLQYTLHCYFKRGFGLPENPLVMITHLPVHTYVYCLGTSEYQAAWILDDEGGEEDDEEEEDGEGDVAMSGGHAGSDGEEAPELVDDEDGEDDGLGE